MFAALDGFEEEGRLLPAELGVGGDWGLKIGHEVGVNWHDVAFAGMFMEFGKLRIDLQGAWFKEVTWTLANLRYSTVTDLARLRGLSTSQLRSQAM